MHNVVINKCYGGFSLSKEAVEALAQKKGMTVKELENEYGDDARYICRHDRDLVILYLAWGSRNVSGAYADLVMEEIADDRYVVNEYDGMERVVTPTNIGWTVIETAPAGAAVLNPNNKPGVTL